MLRRGWTALALLVVLTVAAPASGAVIFTDDFNSENGGVGALNYGGFANFVISAGTVDLIGNGSFEFPPVTDGHGLYVDLDGSTRNAGLMLADPLALIAGNYTLSFQLAGSQRGAAAEVVDFELFINGASIDTGAINKPANEPFVTYLVPFATTGGNFTFSFANRGGDNIGALLDNVQLEGPAQVPEPAMLLLFGTAAVIGAARRRRT